MTPSAPVVVTRKRTMSDRKNRDRGNKKARRHYHCDCWLCIEGKEKKRILKERNRDDRKEIQRELGYSRIGMYGN